MIKHKLLVSFIAVLMFVFLAVGSLNAKSDVTFGWDEPVVSDLAGYKMYQTEDPNVVMVDPNNEVADIPAPADTYTLSDVSDGIHYWCLTAYDLSQNESEKSNVVSTELDTTAPPAPGFRIDNVKKTTTEHTESTTTTTTTFVP